jgi:hypothetical protein
MYRSDGGSDFNRFGMTTAQMLSHLQGVAAGVGKQLYIGELGDYRAADSPADHTAFDQEVYAGITGAAVTYSAPWNFEFYQFSPDHYDNVFSLEPGYTDEILGIIRNAALAAGLHPRLTTGGDVVAPTVALTVPWPGSTLEPWQKLFAVASDDSGTLARVDFYIDGTLVGSAYSPPFMITAATWWLAPGPHTVSAQAFDYRPQPAAIRHPAPPLASPAMASRR